MGVRTITNAAVLLQTGQRWVIEVETTDDTGRPVAGAPSVVVTLPSGTTVSVPAELVSGVGRYRAAYTVASTGRYVAIVATADYGSAAFTAYVMGTTTEAGMPTTDDVAAYMRGGASSWTTEELQDALDAEAAAQRAVCRVGAIYPPDLRQALLRRVVHNLAMRQLPLAIEQGDAGATYVPGRDPEVRRLEGPHRKWVIA
ncbi:hypothetical protein [Micromonospora arida]